MDKIEIDINQQLLKYEEWKKSQEIDKNRTNRNRSQSWRFKNAGYKEIS